MVDGEDVVQLPAKNHPVPRGINRGRFPAPADSKRNLRFIRHGSGHICLTDGPGRKKYLQLTQQGRALSDRAIRPTLEVERGAFLGLAEEERASLLALDRKYLSLLLQKSEQIFNISQEE